MDLYLHVCISVNNQHCLSKPALTDPNPNKLHYYPFMVSADSIDLTEVLILLIIHLQ